LISLQNLFNKSDLNIKEEEASKKRTKHFFKNYCFNCNIFGHKTFQCNTINTSYGLKKIVRCFKCFHYGHFTNQCKLNLKSKQVWKPIVKKVEKSLIVLDYGKSRF
jgi:hypothetical protein